MAILIESFVIFLKYFCDSVPCRAWFINENNFITKYQTKTINYWQYWACQFNFAAIIWSSTGNRLKTESCFFNFLGFIGKIILLQRLCNPILHVYPNLLYNILEEFLVRYLVKQLFPICKWQSVMLLSVSLGMTSISITLSLIVEWSNNSDVI